MARLPRERSPYSRGALAEGLPPPRWAIRRVRHALAPAVTIDPPPAGVRFERDVEVRTRDGTVLRVNVFRPEAEGRYPVIMSAHPYGKDKLPKRIGRWYQPSFQFRMMDQPAPVRFSAWTSWEAPDPAYWVPRGYVIVNADLRGFGHSEGVGSVLSDQEAEDYYDLIEWAAGQEWANGRIGLMGVSYLAISQYKVAALQPPHLAAICPWEGFSDVYRDFARQGGIREDAFIVLWSKRNGGGVLRREQVARPVIDDWWRSLQPDLSRIQVPALICGSFSDHNLHSRGSFEAFRRISSPERWLYTHRGGKWSAFYSPEALAFQSQFFDCFLKGENNGMHEVPPVRLAVYDRRKRPSSVRQETAWPPPQVTWLPLYLNAATGTLVETPISEAGSVAFATRDGRASFAWTIPEDVELVGPMKLRLHVGMTGADDVFLFAGVRKLRGGRHIVFEGSYGFSWDMVTKGWQKASHRRLDPALSEPWWPVHTHEVEEKLAPDEIVPVEIALLPSATLFRRGDVLRLDVQGRWFFPRNPLRGQPLAAYEPSPPGTCTLQCGGSFEAYLLLPAIRLG